MVYRIASKHVPVRVLAVLVALAVAGGSAAAATPIPGARRAAEAASAPRVERCAGRMVASRFGVSLVARHLRVTSTAFNAAAIRRIYIRPLVGCARARRAVDAYLRAKLNRPIARCAGPASAGRACKVGRWLCAKTYPKLAPRPGDPAGMQETCTHLRFRNGIYVGSTNINFWELDYDHS